MAYLCFTGAELSEDLGDAASFNAAAQQFVQLLGTRGDLERGGADFRKGAWLIHKVILLYI